MNIYDTSAMLKMRRSQMDVIQKHKTSFPFGKLVPIGGAPIDILPGDSARLDFSAIIRMLTPLAPLMDDVSGDLYFFFVPWRLVWSKSKNFFGENDQVAWTLPEDVFIPQINFYPATTGGEDVTPFAPSTVTDAEWASTGSYTWRLNADGEVIDSKLRGTLLDYFGLPFVWMNDEVAANGFTAEMIAGTDSFDHANALYFRGYQLIWNEFFRKDAIVDPKLDFLYNGNDLNVSLNQTAIKKYFSLLPVARYNDLYSSLLPAPQRGPSMELPLAGTAPLIASDDYYNTGAGIRIGEANLNSGNVFEARTLGTQLVSTSQSDAQAKTLGALRAGSTALSVSSGISITNTNLKTDLSSATSITVNQLRMIVATQRYYEALARGSARYSSYLEEMFGVRPSDAVLQRPQFLGGHHFSINIAQVLSQADTDGAPLGQTGAYSCTGIKGHMFTNSFQEHGFIMSFVVLRKEHTYCQGKDIEWDKRELFDIYNPKFAHIGEVGVRTQTVYWKPTLGDKLLGFNEPWFEYHSRPAIATGLMNPLHPNSLSYYALTDVLESEPYLDEAFVSEDANGLDSALVASASVTDQFFGDFRLKYTMSRVMPVKSVPGLMDHF